MKIRQYAQSPRKSRAAYAGFLYQTFLKRPFGYVIALLYIVYLAVILLIVPSIMKVNPLFIWNIGGFNMSMFNLFFIAATASSAAVAIFRTGIDDGTELCLSSKPLTKKSRILIKTGVYLSVMFLFCLLAMVITLLIKPVFGTYDIFENPTGIEQAKYIGINLSILLGNIINMLLFGGIAVLISMVGGQVIIMIGTIGVAFVMCLMNVIYPIAVSSPLRVLHDKYNTSINSYSCNTLDQFNQKNSDPKSFAAIQCVTESDGSEIYHFDTQEYWTRANAESGRSITNYVDFAKQLSSLYSTFGIDKSKLDEASKLSIGTNNGFRYHIDAKTHITLEDNLLEGKYPIATYDMSAKQGISYPTVRMLGGNMGLEKDNWYAISTLTQTNFNSVIMASTSAHNCSSNLLFRSIFSQPWFRMSDLIMTQEQIDAANALFDIIYNYRDYDDDEPYDQYERGGEFYYSAFNVVTTDKSGVFYKVGEFENLSNQEKIKIVSQIDLAWIVRAQEEQIKLIDDYCLDYGIDDHFPFTSKTVKSWYNERVKDEAGSKKYNLDYFHFMQIKAIMQKGINVGDLKSPSSETTYVTFVKPIMSTMDYCETYKNLYQYGVTNVYNVYLLIATWSVIAVGLFATAIVVYKKTDFK